ncbi:VWA domain-containing protein [Dactylosporangium sp. CA-139066]|uniref:VWA domain-containing protein n=1 Tax=Dactylosporangium sp. CA-139066 TaxID=3239930 RepID=UPI003D8E11A0
MSAPLPAFVRSLVRDVRRRGIPLGVDDCMALQEALAAGFGWRSTDELRALCVRLWAKSREEARTIEAVFARSNVPAWDVAAPSTTGGAGDGEPARAAADRPIGTVALNQPGSGSSAPPLSGQRDPTLLLVPQYPIGERAVAQVWRRLRHPVRQGPRTRLDVAATVERRARAGVAVPPVLVPAVRNAARLLLLVDRDGSMTPYHRYVEHIGRAIANAARLDVLTVAYFHDVPSHGDRSVLAAAAPGTADLDQILPRIEALTGGAVYADAALTEPVDLGRLLAALTPDSSVAVVSDAGAARGTLDTVRLLDTIALAKAVRRRRATLAWLNPVPRHRWPRTTAGLIARHVPMQPLDLPGMYRAVDALRGRHTAVERPL